MKKFFTVIFLLVSVFSVSAQGGLFYRYQKSAYNEETKSHYSNYYIRIYNVHDDVSLGAKDYLLNDILEQEYDYYRTKIITNIKGNYVSFYKEYNDEYLPLKQFKIESDASLTPIPVFDESKSSSEAAGER